jgi:predicted glycogen debranching enzyme
MQSTMTTAIAAPAQPRPRLSSAPMSLYSLDTHGQLEPFIHREWLLTNGLGGFASSTVVGCNIRKYHGLLVAATVPPVGRMMTLSRIGEQLIVSGDTTTPHELAVNQFRDNLHPRGDRYLRKFELEDTARWTFDVAGVRVTKELLVCWLKNAIGVRYTIDTGGKEVEFRAAPFFAMRDFHSTRHAAGYDFTFLNESRRLLVDVEGLSCEMRADGGGGGANDGAFVNEPSWWYGHVYPIETDRGQDDSEDLFSPGLPDRNRPRPGRLRRPFFPRPLHLETQGPADRDALGRRAQRHRPRLGSRTH